MSLFQNMDSSNNILAYQENKVEKIKIPFWGTNPNVLFQSEYFLEFFPIEDMTYEQKLNALTRSIIVLTIIGFLLSHSFRIIFISAITILAIFLLHYYQQRESDKYKKVIEEHFENQGDEVIAKYGISKENVFDKPSSSNPFSNVLITDYEYNPNKKPAPPSFNQNINKSILAEAKQLVSELNPDQPDISEKLFKDLGEQFVFEQSLRQFTSNPSTVIPNDQTGFAEFAYGSMVSCKEGNLFACARNMDRYNKY